MRVGIVCASNEVTLFVATHRLVNLKIYYA